MDTTSREIEQVDGILRQILKLDSSKGDIAYAQSYAEAALNRGGSSFLPFEMNDLGLGIEIKRQVTDQHMVGKELGVQLLYVLSNLSDWKGEEARESKTLLRKVAKRFC